MRTKTTRIQKLREELASNLAKIRELQARNKELAEEIRVLENTEIIGLVRAVKMTPEQLAELLDRIGNQTVHGDAGNKEQEAVSSDEET